jgi:TolB protein
MNADGSRQRNLTHNGLLDENPVWSSDGRKIAFVGTSGRNSDVYVMNADGSGQRRLTRNATGPVWSPDGRKIAFASGNGEIYVMNADGSGQRSLTRNQPGFVFSFAWSPALKR